MSKKLYASLKPQITELANKYKGNFTDRAKRIAEELNIPYTDNLRKRVGEWVTPDLDESAHKALEEECDTVTETNQYKSKPKMSALKPDGSMMNIREYCEHYGIDFEDVRSYKLVSHTGIPYYNIASRSFDQIDPVEWEKVREEIKKDLSSIKYKTKTSTKTGKRTVVVTIADLHFGAYIDGLIKTHKFSISILVDKLKEIARITNTLSADKVHVHILGDLIESFTGLNHKNSWKGLQKGMIGADAVKLCCKVLHDALLSGIDNLEDIKIIAGNHDRVTSDKTEDVDGDAANLISWGLELIGYKVQFDPFIINHVVDGISYVLLHGHDSISKKSTKDICWDYGKHGMFNLITEGHLHSTIEKLSSAQRKSYNTIKDDAVDHRRMNCPSLFTGNNYSERLGYTSNSGFIISENNGKGVPNVYFYAL